MEKVHIMQCRPSLLYSGSGYGKKNVTIDDKKQFSRSSDSFFIETGKPNYVEHVLSRYKKMKSYTVDKTRIIELLTISNRSANYFVGPRQFGKSFTSSMICTFYDIHFRDLYKELFEGTYIFDQISQRLADESIILNRSTYFIFEINMYNLNSYNFERYEQSFFDMLIQCFSRFSKKYIGVDRSIDFKRNLADQFVLVFDQITNFFFLLCQYCVDTFILDNPSDFQLLIFIDDCQDAFLPFHNDIIDGLQDPRLALFSSFLGSITKNFSFSPYFHKPIVLMAGLIPLPKSIACLTYDIVCHDFQSPMLSHFIGFLSADVEKMFDVFNVSQYGRYLLKNYFNNYQLCSMESLRDFNERLSSPMKWDENLMTFYNPWSLMNSINEGSIVCSFTGGSNLFPFLETMLETPKYIEIVTELSSKRKTVIETKSRILYSTMEDYLKIGNSESLIKLLILSGYLSYSQNMVWIPNQEILEHINRIMRNHLIRENIPLSLPKNINQYFQDRDFFLFFSGIQQYLIHNIQSFSFFNEALINSLLFIWLFSSLKNCQVFIQNKCNLKVEETEKVRLTFADIVIIDERGLFIVIKLKDSTRKNNSQSATEGYAEMFSSKYFDFSENKTVKEVILCCLAMNPDQSTIIFSDLIPKNCFSSNMTMAGFQGRSITTDYQTISNCNITFLKSNQEDMYRLIDSQKKNSALILVDDLSFIKNIDSVSSWMKIGGHNSKEERDFVINRFPENNPYLVFTFAVLSGLDYYPTSDVVFLLKPPELENNIIKMLNLCKNDLIIFYNESQIQLKEQIEANIYVFKNKLTKL